MSGIRAIGVDLVVETFYKIISEIVEKPTGHIIKQMIIMNGTLTGVTFEAVTDSPPTSHPDKATSSIDGNVGKV